MAQAPAPSDALTNALRSLLAIERSEDAAAIVQKLVTHLGGQLAVASESDEDLIPIDVSLGLGDMPTLVRAPAFSVARLHLETYLPRMVEDARQAVAFLHRAQRLAKEAETDPLTSLANRRIADRLVHLLEPDGTVVVVDLDHFKSVNDTFGHDVGDDVLRAFGRSLHAVLRNDDRACRVGGEEFLLIFQSSSADGVDSAMERLRQEWLRTRPKPITFSAGIAIVGHEGGPAAVRAADRALYAAKSGGRDRIVRDVPRVAVGWP